MSQMTIQCRLVASETARRQLWELMAERNTPLINEILVRVGQHSDFPTWRQRGKLPAAEEADIAEAYQKRGRNRPFEDGQKKSSSLCIWRMSGRNCSSEDGRVESQTDGYSKYARYTDALKQHLSVVHDR